MQKLELCNTIDNEVGFKHLGIYAKTIHTDSLEENQQERLQNIQD